jgi:hypothetical protein
MHPAYHQHSFHPSIHLSIRPSIHYCNSCHFMSCNSCHSISFNVISSCHSSKTRYHGNLVVERHFCPMFRWKSCKLSSHWQLSLESFSAARAPIQLKSRHCCGSSIYIHIYVCIYTYMSTQKYHIHACIWCYIKIDAIRGVDSHQVLCIELAQI